MANIKVSNTGNNISDSSGNHPMKFAVNGQSIDLLGSRNSHYSTFFETGLIANYPPTAGGDYNTAATTKVSINFQTGSITGPDLLSVAFTPSIPTAGQAKCATVYITRTNALRVVYGFNQGTLSTVVDGLIAGNPDYIGQVSVGSIRLFSVILTSTNGTSIDNILESNFYSFLATGATAVQSAETLFSDTNLTLVEPLLSTSFNGGTTLNLYKTQLKRGDSINIVKTVTGVDTTESKTVTNVAPGASFDVVTFTPPLINDMQVDNGARVVRTSVPDVDTAAVISLRQFGFDSGWLPVLAGNSGTLLHTENKSFSGYPIVYYNSTASSSNAKLIQNGFVSGVSRIGVWVYLENTGKNTIKYVVGNQGLYYDFNTNTLITNGFIRIILRKL